MACKAAPVAGNRFMGDRHFNIFVFMTSKAELVALSGKQNLALGGMGIVTGAAFSFFKRQMLDVTPGLKIGCFMTRITELAAFLFGFERVLRSGSIVAFLTADFDYKGVGAGFEKFRL